jgi:hypothetical protein
LYLVIAAVAAYTFLKFVGEQKSIRCEKNSASGIHTPLFRMEPKRRIALQIEKVEMPLKPLRYKQLRRYENATTGSIEFLVNVTGLVALLTDMTVPEERCLCNKLQGN